jgi:hypothetical protein
VLLLSVQNTVYAMQSNTQSASAPTLEPTSSKEHGEETIREEEAVNTNPKDSRFWLVMVGLLFATFISALDLTGRLPVVQP